MVFAGGDGGEGGGGGVTHPVEGDAVLLEDGRGDEGHLVSQEGVATLGAAREKAFRGRDKCNKQNQMPIIASTAM